MRTPAPTEPDILAADSENLSNAPPPSSLGGWRLLLLRIGAISAIFIVWQIASDRYVDSFFIGEPRLIGRVIWDWFSTGYIYPHLMVTLQETVLGFLFGAGSGVIVGFLLGRVVVLSKIVDPIIAALYALPRLALAPLFVLWFGIGLSMKVAVATVIVFFLVFYNTFHGVRDVDRDLQDVVRVLGATRRQLLWRVVLPSSLPMIYVGLRLAVPYSLIGAVVGEIVAANRGLGWLITFSAGQFNTNAVFAALIVLMTVALLMNLILVATERHALRWKPSAIT